MIEFGCWLYLHIYQKKPKKLTTMKNKEKFADLNGFTNSLCNLIQEL